MCTKMHKNAQKYKNIWNAKQKHDIFFIFYFEFSFNFQ